MKLTMKWANGLGFSLGLVAAAVIALCGAGTVNGQTSLRLPDAPEISLLTTNHAFLLRDPLQPARLARVPFEMLGLRLNAKAFGAMGNGTNDDTVALQSALDAGAARNQTVYIPPGTYKTSNSLTVNCDLDASTALLETAYTGGPAIVIGVETVPPGSAYTVTWNKSIKLPNISLSVTNDTINSIGVDLRGLRGSTIYFGNIFSFTTGINCTVTNAYCAWNELHLQNISYAKIGINIKPTAQGWFNVNMVSGGEITTTAAANATGYIGLNIDYLGSLGVNGNHFENLTIEGNGWQYFANVRANYNRFDIAALETSNAAENIVLRFFGSNTTANVIELKSAWPANKFVFLEEQGAFDNKISNIGDVYNCGSVPVGGLMFTQANYSGISFPLTNAPGTNIIGTGDFSVRLKFKVASMTIPTKTLFSLTKEAVAQSSNSFSISSASPGKLMLICWENTALTSYTADILNTFMTDFLGRVVDFVFTRSGTVHHIYINGIDTSFFHSSTTGGVADGVARNVANSIESTYATIGSGADWWWSSHYDDAVYIAQVFTNALTATQVATLKGGGSVSGLILDADLAAANPALSTIVRDRSTNRYTGTIGFNSGTTQINPALQFNAENIAAKTVSCSPTISYGTAAPVSTPVKIGDTYINTTLGKIYVSKGTASSADWIITN